MPILWDSGFHEAYNCDIRFDPDLYLIHLHYFDYKICLDRHKSRVKLDWANDLGCESKVLGDNLKELFFKKHDLIPDDVRLNCII